MRIITKCSLLITLLLLAGCAFTTVAETPLHFLGEMTTQEKIIGKWGQPDRIYYSYSWSPAAKKVRENNADELWVYRGSHIKGNIDAIDYYLYFKDKQVVKFEEVTWAF